MIPVRISRKPRKPCKTFILLIYNRRPPEARAFLREVFAMQGSRKRNGSVKTAAHAACPDDQSASGKQAFLRLPESPGPDLPPAARLTEPRSPEGESTHPPFLGSGRAGRDCTPTRRMSTAIDFAAKRPAYLVRAPRHRGRAAPPGAAPYLFREDDRCRGVALRRPASTVGLIGSTTNPDIRPSEAPTAPQLTQSSGFRDDPDPPPRPRPTASWPPARSTYRLRPEPRAFGTRGCERSRTLHSSLSSRPRERNKPVEGSPPASLSC